MKSMDTFKSSNGVDKVHYYCYLPTKEPKAILQIAHGMCEYMGRYDEMATTLSKKGILVCGNDHLGHGSTALKKEDYGYFGKKGGDKFLYQDLKLLTDLMKKKYPQVPYFLFGHSMGSFLTRIYISKYQGLDGVILCGTGQANPLALLGILLAKGFALFKGQRHRSAFVKGLTFAGFNKRFGADKNSSAWLSRDTAITKKYDRDSRCNFTFTAKGFEDLFKIIRTAGSRKTMEKIPKELSLLMISGDMDPLGGYGKGIRRLYEQYKSMGKTVQMKLYKDSRHELINDLDKKLVLEDLFCYITEIIDKK